MRFSSKTLDIVPVTGYLLVACVIAVAWSLRDDHLLRAEDGLGYALGIVGATLMLLLLAYPLRKRVRALSGLGSVRFWFQTHMIFGILGPLLVLLHSNFNLGSLNARVALISTLVVAASGILGRYLYARIHYGMYGHRATLESLQADLATGTATGTSGLPISTLINERLQPYEQAALNRSRRILPSLLGTAIAPITVFRLRRQLEAELEATIAELAQTSSTIAEHRARLHQSACQYLRQRLATYRKFAQLKGWERLFGLWHVVHFPLFLVMVFAAIVHVLAVHAY